MTILQQLQNFNWSSNIIHDLLQAFHTKQYPSWVKTERQRKRFDEKYTNFQVKDKTLFYTPLDLEVIPEDNEKLIRGKLEQLYQQPETIGKGQNNFFHAVVSRYLGIRRKDVINFLKTKPEYQLRQNKPKLINKGIQPTAPYQYWCIDLVDMSFYSNIAANKHYRYIFSCIDPFTKFCWFVPLKKKDAPSSVEAMKKIIDYNVQFGRIQYPSVVVSDNGGEFAGELDTFFQQHKIKHITTKSYTPQPNIENLNLQLRHTIRSAFIHYNSLAWLPHIQSFADAKNTNKDETTKEMPVQLMGDYFNEKHPKLKSVADTLRKKKEERINKYKNQEDIQVDDLVRIKLTSLQSALRKRVKEGNQKLITVRFSPTIYRIKRVFPVPTGKVGIPTYLVEDMEGKVIENTNGNPRRFNAGELLKLGKQTPLTHRINQQRADFLNRIDVEQPPAAVLPKQRLLKPKAPILPKPVSKYSGKDWKNALQGKTFLDFDSHHRVEIKDVYYSYADRMFVVDYISNGVESVAPLQDVLEQSTQEPWFLPEYLS